MIFALNMILLFLIPWMIGRRVIKHHVAAMLNPILYPLVFTYFYLVVPTAYLDDVLPVYGFSFTQAAVDIVDQLTIWNAIVFLVFYHFTPDVKPAPVEGGLIVGSPQPTSVVVAFFSAIVVFIIITAVIYIHGRNLLAIRSDRIAAFEYYEKYIFENYKILTLITVTIGAVQVLIWRYKTIYPIFFLMPFLLLDFLHGGRIMSLIVLLLSYINYIIFKIKGGIYIPIVIGALLIISGILQRSAAEHFDEVGISLGLGEFTTSKIATYYTAQFFLGVGNELEYFVRAAMSILPPIFINYFIPKNTTQFYLQISDSIGRDSGFTNTPLGEALYFGNVGFAVAAPIIVATFYRIALYQKTQVMSFPKFLLFMLIITRTQNAFRLGIFANTLQAYYVMYSYFLFYTLLEWKKPFIYFEKPKP